ncbi:unnamed protein product [Euphydryas editha]|uniref:Glycoside hydrolase family 38 central domain-containing protein n=1 Tax=Euphydryas editha TaxID=104508 RepID=A0AAU9TC09_EUPED|nr:unnamed protein product [Euphydryas editha]
MRRLNEKITEQNGYILYQKGETAGHRGVGFLIKKALKNYIHELLGISDRIAILNINFPRYRKPWTIIQVYAPTELAPDCESEGFYSILADIIKKYLNNYLILMGDFNARVGCREAGEEIILGKHGYGMRSANGHRLIELLLQNNLTLLNSVFKKKPNTKWTWISPDGKYKNEIDYIISNKPKFFNDTHIIQNLNFNTNHRMVRCRLKKFPTKRGRIKMTKDLLKPEQFGKNVDHSTVKTLMEVINSDKSVIEKYDYIDKQLSQFRKLMVTEKSKFSEKTIELLEERKALISNKAKSEENRNKISSLSKQIRENIRKDRKIKRNIKLEEEIQRTGGTKKAFKELREQGMEWIPKLKSNRSKQVTNRREIQQLATAYYRSLYANNESERENKAHKIPNTKAENVPSILIQEVQKAISSQKLEKAPGPDNIPNELIRGTMEDISPILTKLFNDILITGTIPKQWNESHIILLHKKGDKDNLGNYRPISLISNVYKIFAKVILDRITRVLDENQPIEQAGFRKNYSTTDHIHTIKQVLEKYNEYQKPFPVLETKQDDFFPLAYDKHSYTSGMFTSRPTFKHFVREANVFQQTARQLQVVANLGNNDDLFEEFSWIMGVAQDHNVISGAMRPYVKDYYTEKLHLAVQGASVVITEAINKVRGSPTTTEYRLCYFNISSCPNTEVERFYVSIYILAPASLSTLSAYKHPIAGHRFLLQIGEGLELNRSRCSTVGWWIISLP